MSDVQVSKPHLRDIHAPAPLRDMQGWLCWKYETYAGDKKPRKVPMYANGERRYGQQGAPADLAKLTTFAVARDAAIERGMDGVGFAHTEAGGIVTLDFDNCVHDGVVAPQVLDLVKNTYAEFSPSGKGVHAIFSASDDVLGNPKSRATAEQFGVEAFSSKGFTTFSGWMLDHVEILGYEDRVAPLPQPVIEFCQSRFGTSAPAKVDPDDFMIGREPKLGLSVERMEEWLAQLDPDMGREGWRNVGFALHHECDGDDTGFELWNEWSAGGGKYPSEEGLRAQWDSFGRPRATGRRQVTMASVIKMTKDAGYVASGPVASDLRGQAQAIAGKLSQVEGVHTPEGYAGKFPVHGAGDPVLHQSSEWFIKGVLPKGDLIVLYGASGSGKSFIALDMVVSVALGVPWQGCRVKKGKVVLIAAEGSGGVGQRLRAYCKHNGLSVDDINIGVIRVPPNVIEEVDVAELVNSLIIAKADIFVIDTLAQVTPGSNENSSEDMGKALRNIRKVTDATGATALAIHHAGKDAARGARGWSGIRAAADAEIEVSCSEAGRIVRITKMKDGDDSFERGFQLSQVHLGFDSDDDEVTSCVVEYVTAPSKRAKPNEPKGATQQAIMHNARQCGAHTPAGALTRDVIDASVRSVPYEPPKEDGTKKPRDQRRSNIERSLRTLCDKGLLVAKDDRLYFPSVGVIAGANNP